MQNLERLQARRVSRLVLAWPLVATLVSMTAAAVAIACAPSSPGAPADDAGTAPIPTLPPNRDPFPVDASLGRQARYVLGGCTGGGAEAACHNSGAGGLFLPDLVPSNLVDVPSSEQPGLRRVKLGDPANSYLFRKLTGSPTIDGGRMPLGQPQLDDRSLGAISAWIEAGAPAL